MSDCFDFDRVGIAGSTVDETACHYDVVSFFETEDIYGYIETVIEHYVRGIELFIEDRDDAPAEVKSSPDPFGSCHSDDIERASETGYHPCGDAASGVNDDSLSAYVDSHLACSVRDSVKVVSDLEVLLVEAVLIVDVHL